MFLICVTGGRGYLTCDFVCDIIIIGIICAKGKNMKLTDKLNEKQKDTLIRLIRFCIVGAVNTIVDYAVYALIVAVSPWEWAYIPAQALGFVAGTLNAYFMNGGWVFKEKGEERRKGKSILLRTFAGYAVTFLLSEGLLMLWVEVFGINKYIAKLLNLCVTVPLNYIINRFWTFREK